MARQLIYTSAPRGLTPGQSGYCTVARSRDLREALIPRLEKLSYYTPEANRNPVICVHRILDIRGTKFHVLSRIVDAGLDFTRRRSFLAHHLIFEPTELQSAATPAAIFLQWKGWLENWEGEPQWLEDNRPLPAPDQSLAGIFRPNVWITGDEEDRKRFLAWLIEGGADWEITFTNCFQPGDNPADFHIKAAWPNTPGYEAAQRLDANCVRPEDLSLVPRPKTPSEKSVPQSAERAMPMATATPAQSRSSIRLWAAVILLPIVFIAAVFFRSRSTPLVPAGPVTQTIQQSDSAAVLDVLLPDRPTWLAVVDQKGEALIGSIPPVEKLMQQLASNEIFTKDLSGTIQTNVHAPPFPAVLFAQPQDHLIRFGAMNLPPVDLFVSKTATLKTALSNAFAIEIPGRFRILAVRNPIILPREYLLVSTNVELHPLLAERLRQVELPKGSQLALRPLVASKTRWVDPLAYLEEDFALVPSTVLDLPAVQRHVNEILSDKEAKLRAYEAEQAMLTAAQKKLLTDPRTPEELKAKDRLQALQLAVPKAAQELKTLQTKAEAIPKDATQIDRFAVFLCLSNVNSEIIRFVDKP